MIELLKRLYDGEVIYLSYRKDQYGQEFADSTLRFLAEGRWMFGKLRCMGSSAYKLGTCGCNSHPTWIETSISRSKALELIREYLANSEADNERLYINALANDINQAVLDIEAHIEKQIDYIISKREN